MLTHAAQPGNRGPGALAMAELFMFLNNTLMISWFSFGHQLALKTPKLSRWLPPHKLQFCCLIFIFMFGIIQPLNFR